MLTLAGQVIGALHLPKGCTNEMKEIYQQNHYMLVAQAKVMSLCHDMNPDAKIGPALNISLVYAASCRPEDVIAAQNFNAIRNWLYLDASVYGVYNNLVWAYLQENDACPEFADGDAEALKNGHPDLLDLITITRQHAKKVMEQKLTIQLLINKQQEGQRDYIVHTEMNI